MRQAMMNQGKLQTSPDSSSLDSSPDPISNDEWDDDNFVLSTPIPWRMLFGLL